MQKDNHLYGAYYYQPGERVEHSNRAEELYFYKAKLGEHELESSEIASGSIIYLSHDKNVVIWSNAAGLTGRAKKLSAFFSVQIVGYQCGNKSADLSPVTNLPYVNGCSTRQLFPPERIGDPTLLQLTIPPYTAEQVHHIHATPRVVYVLKGSGYSIVGQEGRSTETALTEGMTCILDPMCPHHFRTEGEYLTVLPVHIWSSTPSNMEQNHPMFNGTKEV